MEYNNMRVAELKALTRERGLRGYSRLRKAELIALLQNNPPPPAGEALPSGPRTRPPTASRTRDLWSPRPPRPTRPPPPPP